MGYPLLAVFGSRFVYRSYPALQTYGFQQAAQFSQGIRILFMGQMRTSIVYIKTRFTMVSLKCINLHYPINIVLQSIVLNNPHYYKFVIAMPLTFSEPYFSLASDTLPCSQ